jgi:hypothetical protein
VAPAVGLGHGDHAVGIPPRPVGLRDDWGETEIHSLRFPSVRSVLAILGVFVGGPALLSRGHVCELVLQWVGDRKVESFSLTSTFQKEDVSRALAQPQEEILHFSSGWYAALLEEVEHKVLDSPMAHTKVAAVVARECVRPPDVTLPTAQGACVLGGVHTQA